MHILTRRNLIYLIAALALVVVGHGVANYQARRTEVRDRAMSATAELWGSYELLRTLKDGDTKAALNATAIRADVLVSQIAQAQDRILSEEQREFRTRVLTKYRRFREAHPALYVLPAQIDSRDRQDMLRMQQDVTDFLKRTAK